MSENDSDVYFPLDSDSDTAKNSKPLEHYMDLPNGQRIALPPIDKSLPQNADLDRPAIAEGTNNDGVTFTHEKPGPLDFFEPASGPPEIEVDPALQQQTLEMQINQKLRDLENDPKYKVLNAADRRKAIERFKLAYVEENAPEADLANLIKIKSVKPTEDPNVFTNANGTHEFYRDPHSNRITLIKDEKGTEYQTGDLTRDNLDEPEAMSPQITPNEILENINKNN